MQPAIFAQSHSWLLSEAIEVKIFIFKRAAVFFLC